MSNAPTHSVHSAIATGPLLLLLFLLFGCLAPRAAFAVDATTNSASALLAMIVGPSSSASMKLKTPRLPTA